MSRSFKSLAAVAAAAVLSTSVAAGVAPAAKRAPKVESQVSAVQIKRKANIARQMEAGSAGIPGYDDQRCEELLADWNKALDRSIEASQEGDSKNGGRYSELAQRMERQLTDNCLVVY